MHLKRKVAVVTGSSYGLGKSICDQLLAAGCKVYGVSRTKPKINSKHFVWIKADLLDLAKLKKKVWVIKESKVDILINNAGTVVLEKTLHFTDGAFNKTFDLNFKVPIKIVSLLKTKLEGGVVVNISSTSDRFAEEKYGLYSASKAALNIFFETVGIENPKIKIINLLPSYMSTPLQHKLVDGTDFDWSLAMNTNDVAKFVLSIADNNAKFQSGTNVIVVSNKTSGDAKIERKLWCYNIDSKKLKKLK